MQPFQKITLVAMPQPARSKLDDNVALIFGSANNLNTRSIDFEFSPSPVPPLGVVPDLVISFISEPVGKRPVLPLLLGKPFLHEKSFVSSHMW